MQLEDVKSLVLNAIPDAEVFVQGEDSNFSVEVISATFANLNKLNRQKKVLASVKESVQSGEIHAFSVLAYTPEEWAERDNHLAVL
jgi:monothiol glutaredoxin